MERFVVEPDAPELQTAQDGGLPGVLGGVRVGIGDDPFRYDSASGVRSRKSTSVWKGVHCAANAADQTAEKAGDDLPHDIAQPGAGVADHEEAVATTASTGLCEDWSRSGDHNDTECEKECKCV